MNQKRSALLWLRSPTGAGSVAVVLSAAALAVKLTAGLLTGSIAVLSESVDSPGQHLLAASVSPFSVRLATRPASERHPYGYGKVVTIAAGVEAGFISPGALIIVVSGMVTMAAVPAVNIGVGVFVRGVARQHQSLALATSATHLFTNAVQAAAVFAGLSLVAFSGQTWLDPAVALVLAAYLAWTFFTIRRRTFRDMLNVHLPADDEDWIRRILAEDAGKVRGDHRLRTRRSGSSHQIDLHLILPPEASLTSIHALCDRIEHQIEEWLPRTTVLIHPEPDDGRFRLDLGRPGPVDHED
ncbi:MAG: cation transporter [Dehalococcoidia bacterium]|nr:cation transporter [Dehalococcoidia bacterium]